MAGRSLAVVLGAGKGTRMRSERPKVMFEVGGLSMIGHVLAAIEGAGADAVALVVAPGATWPEAVRGRASVHVQDEQRGTAHAVLAARPAFAGHDKVVVLFGDNPLIRPATVARMLARLDAADVAVLAFAAERPDGYGRLILGADGTVEAIREERDASAEERAITLVNSGVMAIGRRALPLLDAIGAENAKGEHYLTDIVAHARAAGLRVVRETAPAAEVMGVNDRAQLAAAEAEFQRRARTVALETATLLAPETVFFSHDTVVGTDVLIEQNVVFGPGVRIEDGATVRAFCHLEGAVVGRGAVVGPFARLRRGAVIGANARVGNFVELKAATLGAGAKVNHLSYVGDATVGAGANIGAGTITCNYDGVDKHRTVIGEGAFIGSNSALVAPVTVGAHAFVGSGSVITDDVPDDALALGRARQVVKERRSPVARAVPANKEGGT